MVCGDGGRLTRATASAGATSTASVRTGRRTTHDHNCISRQRILVHDFRVRGKIIVEDAVVVRLNFSRVQFYYASLKFFPSRAFDHFTATPVCSRALYLARLVEAVLHSRWMMGWPLVPIVAAYGVAYHASVLFMPFLRCVIVPFLAIPAAARSAITLLLVNMFAARLARDRLRVMTALSIAGLRLLRRAARPERFVASLDISVGGQRAADDGTATIRVIAWAWMPFTIERYAATSSSPHAEQ